MKHKVPVSILQPNPEVKTTEDDQISEERSRHEREVTVNTRMTQREEER